VRVLTQAERRSLLTSDAALRRQGKGSLAFAYKPVPHDFYALLHADAPADGDDGGTGAPSAALAALVGGQVFIGMVSVSLVPRVSPTFVQALRSGGVRFKYMSPDSTRATVAFAGKLGLETEWSFVISLKEPTAHDGATNGDGNQDDSQTTAAVDDYDSGLAARFASQVDQLNVKPPSGVVRGAALHRADAGRHAAARLGAHQLHEEGDHRHDSADAGAGRNRVRRGRVDVRVVERAVRRRRLCVRGAAEAARVLRHCEPPPAWLARERRHELHRAHSRQSCRCSRRCRARLSRIRVPPTPRCCWRCTCTRAPSCTRCTASACSAARRPALMVLLLGVGHLLSWMSPLDVWHVFAVAYGATLPLSVGQLLHAADRRLARRLPGKYAIPKDQAGKLVRALLIMLLPTLFSCCLCLAPRCTAC
jgi:hypothetical protein